VAEFGVRTVVVAATMTLVLPFEGLAQQQWNVGQTINITGRVVTDDGAPPPQPASVALSCGGSAGASASTESSGKFSISVGGEAERVNSYRPVPGYGIGGSIDRLEQRMRGCEVRVTLAGFRAAPVQLTGRRISDNPESGLLFRVRREDWLRRIHSALSSSPKESRMAFEKGVSQNRSRQYRRPGSAWQKRWRSTRNTPKPGTN